MKVQDDNVGREPSSARSLCVVCSLMLAGVVGGCARYAPRTYASQQQIVNAYNANASAVDRLWARAKIKVTISTERSLLPLSWGSTSGLASPNGLLLYFEQPDKPAGPHSFVLIGRETASVELFRLGSSVAQGVYYLWFKLNPENSSAWWGRLAYAGAPCASAVPMDPTQLPAVLCLDELPSGPALPTVAMRFTHLPGQKITDGRQPAYILSCLDRQPTTGQAVFRRDIYFPWTGQGVPREPFRVEFYDHDGHRRLSADLKDYQSIDMPDAPEGVSATMPTNIELEWVTPEGKTSRMHIVLSEMTSDPERGEIEVVDFRPMGIGPDNIIQVDRDCTASGASK